MLVENCMMRIENRLNQKGLEYCQFMMHKKYEYNINIMV